MGHQVIRVGAQWAVKTAWTPDFKTTSLPLCRQLPGAKFNGQLKVWEFSTAPESLFEVIEILVQAQQHAQTWDQGAALADQRAMDPRLYPYQAEGVRTLARMDRFLLA